MQNVKKIKGYERKCIHRSIMGCTALCGLSDLDSGEGTEIGVLCLTRFDMSLSTNKKCKRIKMNSHSIFTGLKILNA
jgi:hypothetical protein